MSDSDVDSIGHRQAKVRKRLGLTQVEMADRLGIPMRTLADNERGISIPGGKVLTAYSALGISVDWLLTGEGRAFREAIIVGTVDLAELRGSTRIAIAGFDATDLFDTYIVDSEERHRRATISLAPEIVNEMVPIHDLGLPNACRLFIAATDNQELLLVDGQVKRVAQDGRFLLIENNQLCPRQIQVLKDGQLAIMAKTDPGRVDFIEDPGRIESKGLIVGSITKTLHNP